MKMKNLRIYSLLFIAAIVVANADIVAGKASSIIGTIKSIQIKDDVTLFQVARDNDVGIDELLDANPHIDKYSILNGDVVIIPSSHLVLTKPKKGIVVNLPERRLYFLQEKGSNVSSYPVGIGQVGWNTPLGKMTIIGKRKNPYWYVPESVLEKHQKDGVTLPNVVPPGPDNPLGPRAMRLSSPTYLIHGTNDPEGIGARSTAGCISMYPEDVVSLYKKTSIKTVVSIINEDLKWYVTGDKLCVELHNPLDISETEELDVDKHKIQLDKQQQKIAMLEIDYRIRI
jgi:L,D-transpeptidase ErfK/SrfK